MKLIYGGPPALPGQCYLCAVATRNRYVDLETQVEFYGAMYLCELCIAEMGQKLGMATEEQVTDLNFKLVGLYEKLEHSYKEIETLKGVLNGYDDVRSFLGSDSLFNQSDTSSEQGKAGNEESVRSGEEGSSKPSDESQLGGLQPSDTGDKSGFSF